MISVCIRVHVCTSACVYAHVVSTYLTQKLTFMSCLNIQIFHIRVCMRQHVYVCMYHIPDQQSDIRALFSSSTHACIRVYMCVCMYVCMHVCICVHIPDPQTYIRALFGSSTHACIRVYVCTCVYVCMYMYHIPDQQSYICALSGTVAHMRVYVCICMYVCMYIFVCVNVFVSRT